MRKLTEPEMWSTVDIALALNEHIAWHESQPPVDEEADRKAVEIVAMLNKLPGSTVIRVYRSGRWGVDIEDCCIYELRDTLQEALAAALGDTLKGNLVSNDVGLQQVAVEASRDLLHVRLMDLCAENTRLQCRIDELEPAAANWALIEAMPRRHCLEKLSDTHWRLFARSGVYPLLCCDDITPDAALRAALGKAERQ